MRKHATFFIPGTTADLAYSNIRDLPSAAHNKSFVELLWSEYWSIADAGFLARAQHEFHQRFWEMYVGVSLLKAGHRLVKHGDEGPEFFFEVGGRRVWVEAVAPTAGTGVDRVPELVPQQSGTVPVEQILLRFAGALKDKRARYAHAIEKGIVKPEDAYVLAINSRGIPHALFGNTLPYFVQAFLPFGPLAVSIDPTTHGVNEAHYQYRAAIRKRNLEPVSTEPFLEPEYSFCSAVIHSGVDCANYPGRMGGDFLVLHNPNAAHPLPASVLERYAQLHFYEGALHRTDAAPFDDETPDGGAGLFSS